MTKAKDEKTPWLTTRDYLPHGVRLSVRIPESPYGEVKEVSWSEERVTVHRLIRRLTEAVVGSFTDADIRIDHLCRRGVTYEPNEKPQIRMVFVPMDVSVLIAGRADAAAMQQLFAAMIRKKLA